MRNLFISAISVISVSAAPKTVISDSDPGSSSLSESSGAPTNSDSDSGISAGAFSGTWFSTRSDVACPLSGNIASSRKISLEIEGKVEEGYEADWAGVFRGQYCVQNGGPSHLGTAIWRPKADPTGTCGGHVFEGEFTDTPTDRRLEEKIVGRRGRQLCYCNDPETPCSEVVAACAVDGTECGCTDWHGFSCPCGRNDECDRWVCNAFLGLVDTDTGETQMVERHLESQNPTQWMGQLDDGKMKMWKARLPIGPSGGLSVMKSHLTKVLPTFMAYQGQEMPEWGSFSEA